MIYAKHIDIPNWHLLRDQLLAFRAEHTPSTALWWCHFAPEVREHLPLLAQTFDQMGLELNQLIFFVNLQNDLDQHDHAHPQSMFIHTDRQDDPDSPHDSVPVLTDFAPTDALNIPLVNCEDSLTLFYQVIDPDQSDVYYPTYNCGGHAHANVKEVHRFCLDQPSVLRVNVPHAVHNPTNEPRVVATFRFRNSVQHLFE